MSPIQNLFPERKAEKAKLYNVQTRPVPECC